jgi:hypothetical protein
VRGHDAGPERLIAREESDGRSAESDTGLEQLGFVGRDDRVVRDRRLFENNERRVVHAKRLVGQGKRGFCDAKRDVRSSKRLVINDERRLR